MDIVDHPHCNHSSYQNCERMALCVILTKNTDIEKSLTQGTARKERKNNCNSRNSPFRDLKCQSPCCPRQLETKRGQPLQGVAASAKSRFQALRLHTTTVLYYQTYRAAYCDEIRSDGSPLPLRGGKNGFEPTQEAGRGVEV